MEPTPFSSKLTRAERARAEQRERDRRHRLAREVADNHDGVATRAMLMAAGLTRGQLDGEVRRGVWSPLGIHTLGITTSAPTGRALWRRALWESSRNAVLDGPTALLAGGLKGWTESVIHVSVPNGDRVRSIEGVRHHRLRDLGETVGADLRRTTPALAAIRAAQWAQTHRQAATLVAMTVQQRLASPATLLGLWAGVGYSARREVLGPVIQDVCAGAESLGELDFAQLCRRRGMPEPTRQAVRIGRNGRVFLDVLWEGLDVHVEIQGAHHFAGVAGVDDALRFNDQALRKGSTIRLQIPVLGLRIDPDPFLDQVAVALASRRPRPGAA